MNRFLQGRGKRVAAILAAVLLAAPLAWAADQKISEMDAASALAGTEAIPGVQSGSNVKITPAQIATYVKDTTFSGALVTKVDDHIANHTTEGAVGWDQEEYDVGGWHDNATNNTRLTVPAGVSRVRLSGCIQVGSGTAGNWALARVAKNGAGVIFGGGVGQKADMDDNNGPLCFASAVLAATAGDYYELNHQIEADTSTSVAADRSWFAIEKVS